MEWQPIETAPKMRSKPYQEVLVLFDGTRHAVAAYSPVMGGWISMYGHPLNEPTHWMPLPPPPVAAQPEREDR